MDPWGDGAVVAVGAALLMGAPVDDAAGTGVAPRLGVTTSVPFMPLS